MSDSARALPRRLIGVCEGEGLELLPTVLFSPDVHWPGSDNHTPVTPVSFRRGEPRSTSRLYYWT